MKVGPLLAAAGVLALSSAPATARTFETRYRLSANIDREATYGGQYLQPVVKARLNLSAEPEYRSEPQYFEAFIGAALDDKWAIVADTSGGKDTPYDTLYLDKNRDGKITSDEKLTGAAWNRRGQTYGPIRLDVNCTRDGRKEFCPQYFQFSLQEYSAPDEDDPSGPSRKQFRLTVTNLGYYVARVPLGGKERLVALVDSNGNGVYNDLFVSMKGRGDMVVLDMENINQGTFLSDGAPQVLGRYLLIDGRYFELQAAPDGSRFDILPLLRPTGLIKAPASDFTVLLSSPETGMIRVGGKNGAGIAPAGEYRLGASSYDVTDSTGGKWKLGAYGDGATTEIQVQSGQVANLQFGPPFSPHVAVEKGAGHTLRFTLNLRGSGGEEYSSVTVGGQMPPVPKARVIDAQGKDVDRIDFHYG